MIILEIVLNCKILEIIYKWLVTIALKSCWSWLIWKQSPKTLHFSKCSKTCPRIFLWLRKPHLRFYLGGGRVLEVILSLVQGVWLQFMPILKDFRSPFPLPIIIAQSLTETFFVLFLALFFCQSLNLSAPFRLFLCDCLLYNSPMLL